VYFAALRAILQLKSDMLARLFYSLHHAFARRRCLKIVPRAQTLLHIDLKQLKNQGIKIVVLDFDGVLSAHGEILPQKNTEQWLMQCLNLFGQENVFVLSNNPFLERQRYIEQLGIHFVCAARKKPYPDGLNYIAQQTLSQRETILLIDDRLLTGILATCLANTRGILITNPYRSFSKNLLKETFFSLLRFLEQRLFL
jgi:predicted HAD superfamily phosphohydrolase YqeG